MIHTSGLEACIELPGYHIIVAENEQTIASVEGFAVAIKKFITDSMDENQGSDFRQIVGGDWRTQITGNIYLVMEGGGPLDGLSNNVELLETSDLLQTRTTHLTR